jgi:hypothetical protein
VDERTLEAVSIADGFRSYQDGDATDIATMLRVVAASPDDRLAVALADGERIVGFLCARTHGPGARLYGLVPSMELTAFEVAQPYRRNGLFSELFAALFSGDLEESIVYAVADPQVKERGESAGAFRGRLETVLGRSGFVPLRTDDVELHGTGDATLFVRVGGQVPTPAVEDLFQRLGALTDVSVVITVHDPVLRNLLRNDLERNGFYVSSVSADHDFCPADIVISDRNSAPGRKLTVRLAECGEPRSEDGTIWYPSIQLDRLPGFLRAELECRSSCFA